jgi:glucosamine-phosphate N-acetyltransferase
MNYKIRKLNINDYNKYLILINEFRTTQFSKSEFIDMLNNIILYSNIWVIEINNELIGTGTILYEKKFIHNISKVAHIEDICISNKYRSKGYGKILIEYLIKEAEHNNCYKITLYCKDELEKFYNSVGFNKNGSQMNIYF